MTIGEKIIKGMLKGQEIRLEKLKEINAPQVMIDGTIEIIDGLKAGFLPIKGDKSLLHEEFCRVTEMVGRGGKKYYLFNEDIFFFPNARYGMFIRREDQSAVVR